MTAPDVPATAMDIYQMLDQVPGELHDAYLELTEQPIETLAVLLGAIRDARADLATLYDAIENDLTFLTAARRFNVDGFGEVEILKADKRSKWDNEALTKVVVAYALDERYVDPETGEAEPGWETVARVLSECARPSWRLTPLRSRGIDPDEFCTVEEGKRSVKLPPRAR